MLLFAQESQEGYRLDCFAQAHFVSEDSVDACLVQTDEPVERRQLVVAELAALQTHGLAF